MNPPTITPVKKQKTTDTRNRFITPPRRTNNITVPSAPISSRRRSILENQTESPLLFQ